MQYHKESRVLLTSLIGSRFNQWTGSLPDGHSQYFVLGEFLVWWMCRHEFPQLAESAADVLLTPALPAVGEHLAHYQSRLSADKVE